MIPPQVIAKMAVLGLTEAQASAIALMLSEVEKATEVAARVEIEARRANDRERKARQLHGSSRERTGASVKSGPNAPRAHAFSVGEEVVLPPENATHSTPKGEKRSRASRLWKDWKPDGEMRGYARDHRMTEVEIDRMGTDMVSWSLSSPNGKKLDWKQTWESWVRRFVDKNPRESKQINGNHGGTSAALRNIQLREIEKRRDGSMLDLDGGGTGGTADRLLPKG